MIKKIFLKCNRIVYGKYLYKNKKYYKNIIDVKLEVVQRNDI